MPKSHKCGLCEKTTKTHRLANRAHRRRSGVGGLKVLKPRSARIRKFELEGTYDEVS